MTAFPGISHVAVTATDLARSTQWYSRLFGAEPVLDEDEQTGGFHHTVFALDSGQLFGLHMHPQPATDPFDQHRTGMDHVSFACRNRGELQTWTAKLDELDVAHGPIVDAHYGPGISFRDPDQIALEFFTPASLNPSDACCMGAVSDYLSDAAPLAPGPLQQVEVAGLTRWLGFHGKVP